MIALNNTVVGSKAGWYESGYWHHAQHRDNLLFGQRTAMPSVYLALAQRSDLDYDGIARVQSNFVKFNGTYYATFPALAAGAGQEPHGVDASNADLVRAPALSHPEWDWASRSGTPTL